MKGRLVMNTETQTERSQALAMSEAARIDIINKDTLDKASFLCKGIKLLIAEVDGSFKGPIKAAHDAHKSILASYNSIVDPLLKAEKLVKAKMGNYLFKEEEKRAAEERRINGEKRLAQAIEAESRGDVGVAESIINGETFIPPVIIAQDEKPQGVSSRKIIKWRIKDESQIPREFMMPDEAGIGKVVRALGGEAAMKLIPGIEIYYETSVTQRIA